MSITVTTDVFCDGCPNWFDGGITGSRPDAVEARRVARLHGGYTRERGADGKLRDLCPRCASGADDVDEEDEFERNAVAVRITDPAIQLANVKTVAGFIPVTVRAIEDAR